MITEFEQHKIKNLYTKYQINTQNQLAFEEMAKRYGYEVERSSFHDFYLAFQRNARGETLYGLIDTNIHIKIDFEYDEAFYFDETGYAKVKKNNIYYLMDTTGKLEYKLAIDINQLDKNITALYLTDRRLEEIPSIVFNHSQLKILKLDLKKLDSVPSEIGQLTNLKKLCITTTSRKEGVGVTEKLEKLLPNCKISINDWR
jgi:hypothetical protein